MSMHSRIELELQMLVFEERENQSTGRKISWSRVGNQQQTQLTFDVVSGNRILNTLRTFSNTDFCDCQWRLLEVKFIYSRHLTFTAKPSSLCVDVKTPSVPLSTKREYIFFHSLIMYHFFLILFPKASK